jgi:predicted aspartyl protease
MFSDTNFLISTEECSTLMDQGANGYLLISTENTNSTDINETITTSADFTTLLEQF